MVFKIRQNPFLAWALPRTPLGELIYPLITLVLHFPTLFLWSFIFRSCIFSPWPNKSYSKSNKNKRCKLHRAYTQERVKLSHKKGKAEHLYNALQGLHGIQTTIKRSRMDHTVLPAINTMPAFRPLGPPLSCHKPWFLPPCSTQSGTE